MLVDLGNAPEYCVLRDNVKLRVLVNTLAKEYGMNRTVEEAGVDKRNLYKYLKGSTKEIGQRDLIKVCNVLGIKIHFDVEV